MHYLNKSVLLPVAALLAISLAGCGKQAVKSEASVAKAPVSSLSPSVSSPASGMQPPSAVSVPVPAFAVCPDPNMVTQNKDQGVWQYQGQYWSLGTTNWGVGDKMEFMEAFITPQGGLDCYYRWPNSNLNQPGSWLWMSVQLNPLATEVVVPYGQHWQNSTKPQGMLCQSRLTQTCAYTIKNVTPSASVPVAPAAPAPVEAPVAAPASS
jgi:hypothetical protein